MGITKNITWIKVDDLFQLYILVIYQYACADESGVRPKMSVYQSVSVQNIGPRKLVLVDAQVGP